MEWHMTVGGLSKMGWHMNAQGANKNEAIACRPVKDTSRTLKGPHAQGTQGRGRLREA